MSSLFRIIATALVVLSLSSLLTVLFAPVQAQVPTQRSDISTKKNKLNHREIEERATRAAQQEVDRQPRIDGQGEHVTVIARLDDSSKKLYLNFSLDYLPENAYANAEFEDLRSLVWNAVMEVLRGQSDVSTLEFQFGGKSLDELFPEERLRDEKIRSLSPAVSGYSSINTSSGPVVVAAGHGIYYHYGFKDWRAQRDKVNGITEDFITPDYADELALWLGDRSKVPVMFARSLAASIYLPSGKPWWEMGAKYNLKESYPENPEIWDSRPEDQTNLRDRNEDINSRPLFANHLAANTIIHLHTNADSSGLSSGARVFVHGGRLADQKLGDNILCYMDELIHAIDKYKGYIVSGKADAKSDLAENRLARMPSAIVESGFHTNPKDAVALQDSAFRTAAMKGVEKGFRLTNDDKPCKHFNITDIPNVTAPDGARPTVKVYYEGYPQFPIKTKIEYIPCPIDPLPCPDLGGIIPDPIDSPMVVSVGECVGVGVQKFKTTMIDTDGVKTSKEHTLTCTAGGREAR
jgi:N-acetylmuramoyl-L-alanine amidase